MHVREYLIKAGMPHHILRDACIEPVFDPSQQSNLSRFSVYGLALVLAAAFFSPVAAAEDHFDNWYQVDVILFKPKKTDLDEESWPEKPAIYPADVTAVTGAGVFRLSQLEQLDALLPLEESREEQAHGASDFAFEGLGNKNRNRRVIERASGIVDGDTSNPSADSGLMDGADTDNQATEANETVPDSATTEDLIDSLLANSSAISDGQLAFADREAESSLQAILRSLRRSSRYTVLGHHSWLQPIDSEAIPILIQAGQRYDDLFEVEGTLSINRSRFLHVQTNLWFTRFEPRGGNASPYLGGFRSSLPDEVLSQYPDLVEVEREHGQFYAARTHAMLQSRRMRSDELHYIDHPLFGVIIKINRFSPDTDQAR